jgi:hypothetical protein
MDIKSFILAGSASFTLENKSKGTHLSFSVRACKDKPGLFFVYTGRQYLGTIRDGVYGFGKKSELDPKSAPALAFPWFFALVMKQYPFPPSLSFHHQGRCGRCGRKLNHPNSIASGLGPECAKSRI